MTRQIVLRAPLLDGGVESSSRGGSRMGEVVGGAAAVCCCCPCGLLELLVLGLLAVYKVPAGICRKALRGRRRRKKGLLPARGGKCELGGGGGELFHVHSVTAIGAISAEFDKEVAELEKEMWERFYGAGFWRSPSQRSDLTDSPSNNSSVTLYRD